ncbi:DUF4176 domain-containing protein [Leifsonia sp. NPDC056665]|uniref:DUF4176 domain-containing protein n=1 Tax=Leifsonia sp. NPDC056665 TaxID=3345901 RepID=UPI0036CBAE1B
MTEEQQEQGRKRVFLPLGSVVILKGSVKKLLVVSRGSIVEGDFFDYGAFMYPEGMIDTNIAYFNHDDILKIVHEGYTDDDNDLVLEILDDAYAQFQHDAPALASTAAAPVSPSAQEDDPFASVRDLVGDDE